METLYELTQQYTELLRAILDAEEGDDTAALTARLDEIGEGYSVKAENYARLMIELDVRREATKAEADRLTKRAKRFETIIEAMKARMLNSMQALGAKAVDTTIGCWSIRKNPPSVEIIDAARIPKEYLIEQAPKISKTAILAAFKADGEIVPGCDIVRKDSISFK